MYDFCKCIVSQNSEYVKICKELRNLILVKIWFIIKSFILTMIFMIKQNL